MPIHEPSNRRGPEPEALILFTRFPEPGRTKTRLIPVLGAEGAADLQRRMTERIVEKAAALAGVRAVAVDIRYEGGTADLMRRWLGPGWTYRPQGAGDIGERMARALGEAFGRGVERAVLIGSDIPGITAELLKEAFESLSNHDVVLGPAADGGYYLIGFTRDAFGKVGGCLLADVPWGTERVFPMTLQRIQTSGTAVRTLSLLRDVDRPDDLEVWGMERP